MIDGETDDVSVRDGEVDGEAEFVGVSVADGVKDGETVGELEFDGVPVADGVKEGDGVRDRIGVFDAVKNTGENCETNRIFAFPLSVT